MDKKIIPIIGLGTLVASYIVKGNDQSSVRGKRSENSIQEVIIPGMVLDEFVSTRYQVSFKYPTDWVKNPRYADKYEGNTGFFEIGDFSGIGEDIDQAVQQQINEAYQPYGSNPTVRNFVVDGQPARVIYPSEDQSSFFSDREVAIVVQYKAPIIIDDQPYKYVVVWTDKEHVPLILSTFKFIEE